MGRQVAVPSQLIALIAEDVPCVVQFREAGDVADIAGKPVLAGEGRNRIGVLDVQAQFIGDK